MELLKHSGCSQQGVFRGACTLVSGLRVEGLPLKYVVVANLAWGWLEQKAEDRQAVSVPLEHLLMIPQSQP